MNEELQVIDLTYKLQYELSNMKPDELARFLHGKLIRYDNKLYQYQGVKNAIIPSEHEVEQEQT